MSQINHSELVKSFAAAIILLEAAPNSAPVALAHGILVRMLDEEATGPYGSIKQWARREGAKMAERLLREFVEVPNG